MPDDFVFEFDKFMQDTIENVPVPVHHNTQGEQNELTPQREYIRRYRELPQNRTTWRR
jgi:hypothetical protein